MALSQDQKFILLSESAIFNWQNKASSDQIPDIATHLARYSIYCHHDGHGVHACVCVCVCVCMCVCYSS